MMHHNGPPSSQSWGRGGLLGSKGTNMHVRLDEKLEPIYQELLHRNPGETEFHQAVHEVLETMGPVLSKYPDFVERKIIQGRIPYQPGVSRRIQQCIGSLQRGHALPPLCLPRDHQIPRL